MVTLVKVPKLKIEKFVNRDDLLTLNEDLTYTIVVTNIGENIGTKSTIFTSNAGAVPLLVTDIV